MKPRVSCIICRAPFDNPQKGTSRRKYYDNGKKGGRKYCKDCAKDVRRKTSRERARRIRNRQKRQCRMCNSTLQFNRWTYCTDKCRNDFVKLSLLNKYISNAERKLKEWKIKKEKILNRQRHITEILNK